MHIFIEHDLGCAASQNGFVFLDSITSNHTIESLMLLDPNSMMGLSNNQLVEMKLDKIDSTLIEQLIQWLQIAKVNLRVIVPKRKVSKPEIQLLAKLLNANLSIVMLHIELEDWSEFLDETIIETLANEFPGVDYLKKFVLSVNSEISDASWNFLATSIGLNRSLANIEIVVRLISSNPMVSSFRICDSLENKFGILEKFNRVHSHCKRIIGELLYLIDIIL
jgi:hypothetical protein